ncbi:hypothetical protein PFISCL1PPCAC_4834, partial [Pristionchus fissidentatus]
QDSPSPTPDRHWELSSQNPTHLSISSRLSCLSKEVSSHSFHSHLSCPTPSYSTLSCWKRPFCYCRRRFSCSCLPSSTWDCPSGLQTHRDHLLLLLLLLLPLVVSLRLRLFRGPRIDPPFLGGSCCRPPLV